MKGGIDCMMNDAGFNAESVQSQNLCEPKLIKIYEKSS